MKTKVKISEIVDGMEMQFEGSSSLLNIKTGEVTFIPTEYLREAEEGEAFEDLEDWQQEELEEAYDVIENEENYVELPTEFDIHEYRMIENFSYSVEAPKARNSLLRAIQGRGAFRRFKDRVFELDLEEDWYAYRDECYKQIAIEFCEQHDLDYTK
ncbi:hypothetical protein CIL03_16340 [Virgibacillus indicus]|uniref:Uncharacterized protein n=1 Tax=Virgibacillus indicus TaxID=2024554 RepID=A0A265N7G8_9BACI|nr:UPF0158 family protein [Virgibacillus indicus]OZU87389.1 hypothetical protein CIL03_16340 [Virgibacillus indicus]